MAQIFTPQAMTLPDRAYVNFLIFGVVVAIATEDRAYVNFLIFGVVVAIAT